MRSILVLLVAFFIAGVKSNSIGGGVVPSREIRSSQGGIPGAPPAFDGATPGTEIRGDVIQPFIFHNAVIQEFHVSSGLLPKDPAGGADLGGMANRNVPGLDLGSGWRKREAPDEVGDESEL